MYGSERIREYIGTLKKKRVIAIAVGLFIVCSFLPIWTVCSVGEWETTSKFTSLWRVFDEILAANPYVTRLEMLEIHAMNFALLLCVLVGILIVAASVQMRIACKHRV